MSEEELVLKRKDTEGSRLYDKFKERNSSQRGIVRVADNPDAKYQCEITGKVFEGPTAQNDYMEHMKNIDWSIIQPDIEHIKNPKKMSCLFIEYDATTPSKIDGLMIDLEKERAQVNTVEDILNVDTSEPSAIKEQIVCSVCETKSKFLKDDMIRYVFKDLDSYDEHLWGVHAIAVKRNGEKIIVENTKTGENFEE